MEGLIIRKLNGEDAGDVSRINALITRKPAKDEFRRMVEELAQSTGNMSYVAEYQGQWLALLGWSAAAYHLKGRESWIGWNDTQRRARLSLVANKARFCLLTPAGKYPNLASYMSGPSSCLFGK